MKHTQGSYRLLCYWFIRQFPHHIHILVTPFIITVLLLFSIQTQASDLTQLRQSKNINQQNPTNALPIGSVLDSQGQPIAIPQPQSALEYAADEMQLDRADTIQVSSDPVSMRDASAAKVSPKMVVANDPSCRWLANRIKQLSTQLKHNKDASYLQTELSHRQDEWQCMDCQGSGPAQGQQAECQYRR